MVGRRILTNRLVRLACERHLRDLEEGPKRGLVWDVEAVKRVGNFFKGILRLNGGAHEGKPFVLQRWQLFIEGSLFGWKRADTGARRFRTAYLEIAKGNGKSPMAAGTGVYMLTADKEPRAEVYAAAAKKDQAMILYRDAVAMVDQSPELSKRIVKSGINPVWNLTVPSTRSFFRPIASDDAQSGPRPHCALLDEIHEHDDATVIDMMRAGSKGRTQALFFEITNSGWDQTSVCWRHHDYSEQVLEQHKEDDEWFAYICGLDVGDDYKNEKVWVKANPNLGVTITKDYLRRQVREAEGMPAQQGTVRRLNFCEWCVTGDTLISMADGTLKRADKILAGDLIVAFDDATGQLVRARVRASGPNGVKPVWQITTARGRQLKATGNHRLWARLGRPDAPRYTWVPTAELVAGSRVAAALGYPRLLRGSHRITSAVARFLGQMVGDGTCAQSGIRFTNQDAEVIASVRGFVESEGCLLKPLPDGIHWDVRHGVAAGTLKQTPIKKLLKTHGLYRTTSHTKRVPTAVWKGGANIWAAFLSGYLDTDGWVTDPTTAVPLVAWASVNEALLLDCQHLLARLGAQSSVNRLPNGQYRLEIRDAVSLGRAADRLTPTHALKAARIAGCGGRKGPVLGDRRNFDYVTSVEGLEPQPTFGMEIEGIHTHVTNGLISHNTELAQRWIEQEVWDRNKAPVDLARLVGRRCFGALDLSSTEDMTCYLELFPWEDGFYDVVPHFWMPEASIHRRGEQDRQDYVGWARDGFLTLTRGDIVDQNAVKTTVLQSATTYALRDVAFDRWNSSKIVTELTDEWGEKTDDEEGPRMVQFGQGYASMSAPTKELEGLLLSGRIRHGGHPVLAWNAANTVVAIDAAENKKPVKSNRRKRIDGVVALIMAIGRAMVAPAPQPSSDWLLTTIKRGGD